MQLTRRVSLFVAATLSALSLVLFCAVAAAMLVSAFRVDANRALEESRRAELAIDNALHAMEGNAADWSMWDDTYSFLGGENPEYIDVNLPADTFANLELDLVGFFDPDGSLRQAIGSDVAGRAVTIPGVSRLLEAHPALNAARQKDGLSSSIVRLPDGRLMMVAAGSVLPSDKKGPSRGTLAMGRLLTPQRVAGIAEQTQLDMEIYAGGSPAGSSTGATAGSPPAGSVVHVAGPRTIEVVRPLPSFGARSVAQLRVTRPRDAWGRALDALTLLAMAIVGLLVLTMALMHRGIDRMILSRVFSLDSSVSRIRATGVPESLDLPGDDELSTLADNVEHLVTELDSSRREVERSRDELEVRIAERTAELRQAVDDLTAQIERREEAELAQEASERRYSVLIENLSDVVFTVDRKGIVQFVSSAVVQLLGGETDGYVGRDLSVLLGEAGADLARRRIKRGLSAEGAHVTIDGCVGPAGPLDLELVLTPLEHSSVVQGIVRDITARRQHENELLHMASHDFLTGLWNRRRFEDELSRVLDDVRVGRSGAGAILWLDLDGFKDVNDTLGHKAGDELLGNVAARLTESVRSGSIVARLGGDEFAVLLPSTSEAEAVSVAERLVHEIGEVKLESEGCLVRASTSLGVVLYPEHGTDVDELLSKADMAMYSAKEHGRSRYAMFNPSAEWKNGIEDRRVWTELVESALAEGGFAAYAQPIRSIASGKTVSYELLVRMLDFEGTPILPDRFLPVAERTGMIVDIDIWILYQAVRMLEAHPDEDFRLNVNASPRTLSDPRFLDELSAVVLSSSIDPSRLVIEITETAIIIDVASVNDTLRRIKKLGCRIALDDFGSGFTSFLHLKQLPVDDIKIDGSFVRNVDANKNDQHLVKAMVEMAKGLNMQTTAEFVESHESLDMLRSFGVEHVQGFVIGRPVPVEEVLGQDGANRDVRLGA